MANAVTRTSHRTLGIFAKYWEPGAVKTRLAAVVGPTPAAHLQYLCLRTLVRRLSPIDSDRVLCFSPLQMAGAFRRLLDDLHEGRKVAPAASADQPNTGWSLQPQSGGDLGDRMGTWFDRCFQGGYAHAILLGADSPTMPLSVIDQAWQQLQQSPVVLAPSRDGGYYLVGAAASAPPTWLRIFNDMRWSTPHVYEQTHACLLSQGIPFAELAPWYDIDEWSDLPRLLDDLRDHPEDSELREFVQQLLTMAR